MGVLSALPLIKLGNICCCLWVITGGVVAAYVLQQNQGDPIEIADGALVGLFAGLIGAVIELVLSLVLSVLLGPMERELRRQLQDTLVNMPPEFRNIFDQMNGGRYGGGLFFLGLRMAAFFFSLVIGAVFSTIGGVIGASIFRKQPPPRTIDVTPTPGM
jgi:hypothetical protein